MAYVDDLIVISSRETLDTDVTEFLSKFEGTQEEISWYLDVHVLFKSGSLQLSKQAYTDQCLAQFGLEKQRTYGTCTASKFFEEIVIHDGEQPLKGDNIQKMIGCLQFLSHRTHPDLSTAIEIFS